MLRGWHEGREYPVVKDRSVLGRDEAADILLLRDRTVEKRHAVLCRDGRRYLLRKAAEAPALATRVNGEPLLEADRELHDGDRASNISLHGVGPHDRRRAPRPL